MSEKSKNILFLTPGFAADESDSSCIPALQDFFIALNERSESIRSTIVSIHYPNNSVDYYWHNIAVYPIGANNSRFPKRLFSWLKLLKKVKTLHQKNNFDLIHCFWYDESAFLAQLLSKKLKIPVYCTFMGQDAIGSNPYIKRLSIPESRLVALSDFQKEKIRSSLNLEPLSIIPWGVHLTQQNVEQRPIDIINIGSFNEIKSQNEAIKIIHSLKSSFPEINCLFIGDGANFNTIKAMVSKLELQNNVTLIGHQERSFVMDYLSKSKVLLHCSDFESYGMIFAEAISTKTAIVSKSVGIAKQKDWWRIYSSKEEAIANLSILLNSDLRPKETDQKDVDIKTTIDQYLQLWK